MCDANLIMGPNLTGRHQIGQRLYEQALDRALQRTGAISEIGPLGEQKSASTVRQIDIETLVPRGAIDALPHQTELNIDDPVQFLFAQGFKNYDLVQSIDEFRRELPTGRLHADPGNPAAELRAGGIVHGCWSAEAQLRIDQGAHFSRAEITRHEDHRG